MNPELMKFIELLLRQNVQFTVTSAFRTKRQNEACNGAENSQHLTGDAIDLKPVYLSVADFISKIKGFPFKYDQIITYHTFVHVSFARGRNPRQMELNFAD
jgi:hypothetical protein